jgi:hypothetical protein
MFSGYLQNRSETYYPSSSRSPDKVFITFILAKLFILVCYDTFRRSRTTIPTVKHCRRVRTQQTSSYPPSIHTRYFPTGNCTFASPELLQPQWPLASSCLLMLWWRHVLMTSKQRCKIDYDHKCVGIPIYSHHDNQLQANSLHGNCTYIATRKVSNGKGHIHVTGL